MSVIRRALRIVRDSRGAATIEFALIGPAMIVMLFGVLQIGLALQNYNALRSASAEVARYALVQYGTGNALTNAQLQAYAVSLAQGAPYMLSSDRMIATVADAGTQRVTGATEKTLTIEYRIPSVLNTMGVRGPYITYERPLFLTTPTV